MLRTLIGMAVVFAIGTPAPAQICAGSAAFSERPVQLRAGGSLGSGISSIEEGAGVGWAGPFVQFELGTTTFHGFAGSPFQASSFHGRSFNVRGAAGYQVTLSPRASLCPVISLGAVVGPNNMGGTTLNHNELDLVFGVSAGVVATQSTVVQVIPNASLAVVEMRRRFEDAFGSAAGGWDTFGRVGLGMGLVVSRQYSVLPVVSIPVGLQGAPTSFVLTLQYSFGRSGPGS